MINQPKNTRRLFIGFNLPDSDLEICEEVLKNLKDRGIYNITKLANIHITLCFLGNVKSELLIEIIQKFDNQKFELDNLKFEFNNFQVKYSTKSHQSDVQETAKNTDHLQIQTHSSN